MRAGEVAEKISPRTKAIMIVHLYGLPVDLDPLLALAAKHGLRVIEDAAEMQRLCEVFEASDEEGRRLIRLFAELSVSDVLQIPPRT